MPPPPPSPRPPTLPTHRHHYDPPTRLRPTATTPHTRPIATQRLLRRQIHGATARPASTPNSVGADWDDHALLGLPGFTPGTLASPLPGSWRDSKTGAMQSPAHPRYASAPRYPGGVQPTHLADMEASKASGVASVASGGSNTLGDRGATPNYHRSRGVSPSKRKQVGL